MVSHVRGGGGEGSHMRGERSVTLGGGTGSHMRGERSVVLGGGGGGGDMQAVT